MFLSKLGYSELVQRIFEKITFFRVDPLTELHCEFHRHESIRRSGKEKLGYHIMASSGTLVVRRRQQ